MRVCRKAQQESKVGKETNFVLQDMPEDQCGLCVVRDQANDSMHVQVALNLFKFRCYWILVHLFP